MKTTAVLEQLLFANPNLLDAFRAFGLIQKGKEIVPYEHKELKNLLFPFKNIRIIGIWGLIEQIVLVGLDRSAGKRQMPVIYITGNNSDVGMSSKGKLEDDLLKTIDIRDFLPSPIIRKIVYMNDTGSLSGKMYSEVLNNVWIEDADPLSIRIDDKPQKRCGPNIILHEVLKGIDTPSGFAV